MSKFNKIPLAAVCNHKLIYSRQENANANIGLDGMYISERDIKLKPNDTIDGIEFEFYFGEYDNIECALQKLGVNASADKLHIMGFALWSDAFSVFKLVYENGGEDYVTVPFIDWTHSYAFNWFDMSSVGGEIVSHGAMASGAQSRPVYLHHITVDLPKPDKIKEIILPDNFCMHIMAVTLETPITSKEAKK